MIRSCDHGYTNTNLNYLNLLGFITAPVNKIGRSRDTFKVMLMCFSYLQTRNRDAGIKTIISYLTSNADQISQNAKSAYMFLLTWTGIQFEKYSEYIFPSNIKNNWCLSANCLSTML